MQLLEWNVILHTNNMSMYLGMYIHVYYCTGIVVLRHFAEVGNVERQNVEIEIADTTNRSNLTWPNLM
jgi:hypothetical protein